MINYRNLLERIRNFVLLDRSQSDLKHLIASAFEQAGVDLHNPLPKDALDAKITAASVTKQSSSRNHGSG